MHLTKAEIIRRGVELGVDYALTHSCYDPDTDGRACGALRHLPAPTTGFAAAGMVDPAPYQEGAPYRHELRGQGDLLHAPRRGGERRAAGRVLSLRRVQPLDRDGNGIADRPSARSATRTSSGRMAPDGGRFRTAKGLAAAVAEKWPASANGRSRRLVVCTGGEPLLQMDSAAIGALHDEGFEIAVETNGTIIPPEGIDWICVSPKAGSVTQLLRGSELKLVYPQAEAPPERFAEADFDHFYLQPMDGPDLERNTALAINYCLAHPQWRLSVQTHKVVGIR